ncbi:MAG: energy transducer TonB [Bacteroidia bacterium]
MKSNSTIEYLEVVFENCNKDYGFFELRKNAVKYLAIAFSLAMFLVTCVFVGPFILEKLKPQDEPLAAKPRLISYAELAAPPPIDKNVVLPPDLDELPQLIKSTLKFLPPVIKPDAQVFEDDLPPTQQDLKMVAAGETTVEGNDSIFYDNRAMVDMSLVDDLKNDEKTPMVFAEQMPVFPGGNEALLDYIQKNIVYPPNALENHIQGRVTISFVVNKNGKVDRIEVVKGIGFGCDEEAIRVIQSLPKWKPGMQNGVPVSVRMMIPIQFVVKDF